MVEAGQADQFLSAKKNIFSELHWMLYLILALVMRWITIAGLAKKLFLASY